MDENPHRVSRRNHGGTHCQNNAVDEENRRCTRKRCRSWAASAIADCVALCCCPCAIINLLTLTFVKVPWMIGRRCLGKNKRKKKKNSRKLSHRKRRRGKINGEDGFQHNHHRRFETAEEDEKCGGDVGCYGVGGYEDHRFVVEKDGSLTKEEEDEGKKTSLREDHDESRISARVEAERVWLELYQIGHLGFGRVSFTGVQ